MNIIEKLHDLIKQATTERSHYYVASTALEAAFTIERLQAALEEIADKHVGDAPASVHHNEAEWVWQHIRDVRRIARRALEESMK